MRPLVILRPEPGNTLSAERARKMGFGEVVSAPLFKVRRADWTVPDPDRFDAIVLTSANAARHAGQGLEQLRRLPVHAVGEATAGAAHAAGLMVETVGQGGLEALLDRLTKPQRLLHLCGQHRRTVDPGQHVIVSLPVYSSVARDDPRGIERLPGSTVCVHSPRAGKRLAELVDREGMERSDIMIAAISEAAAHACGDGWAAMEVAANPDDPTVLALAKRLCQNSPHE